MTTSRCPVCAALCSAVARPERVSASTTAPAGRHQQSSSGCLNRLCSHLLLSRPQRCKQRVPQSAGVAPAAAGSIDECTTLHRACISRPQQDSALVCCSTAAADVSHRNITPNCRMLLHGNALGSVTGGHAAFRHPCHKSCRRTWHTHSPCRNSSCTALVWPALAA